MYIYICSWAKCVRANLNCDSYLTEHQVYIMLLCVIIKLVIYNDSGICFLSYVSVCGPI